MRHFVSIWLLLICTWLRAVEPELSVADTIYLEEITFYGDLKRYQPGTIIDRLTPLQQEISREGGLEQVLSRFMPIYIKSNAGGLSTIRFRGTAPDHTAIRFGGININSLTLGHSNLSNVATFLFDRIELQYGSSSAVNGSGAVGGAVYLGQQNRMIRGAEFQVNYAAGSFGEQMVGAKIHAGNGKLESITKLFLYEKENNFPFKNPYHPNRISHPGPIDDVQHGAVIQNKGVLQELNYRFSPNRNFKSMVWYEESWHQIQPNMQSNLDFKAGEEIYDKNLRFWSQFKDEEHLLKYQVGAGYVHDNQVYNKFEEQVIITDRLVMDASLKQTLFRFSEYRVGANYQYIVPNVYSYSEELIKNEQHINLYFSWLFEPVETFRATVNLRQQFVTGFRIPFTPALLAEYIPVSSQKHLLSLNTSVSRSYRIPTLNDRYWGDQGNPDLLPEDGFNLEGGIKYAHRNNQNHSTLRLNLFFMDIDNWIEWRNFGVWKAQNVQRVISKGVEFHAETHYEYRKFTFDAVVNYTYNPVEQIENLVSGDPVSQQLMYAPKHIGNLSGSISYGRYTFFADGSFTGERYTDYTGAKLPSHFLVNAGFLLPFSFMKHEAKMTFQSLNLLNTQYQNEKYYAMPGRSFKISLSVKLNFTNLNH